MTAHAAAAHPAPLRRRLAHVMRALGPLFALAAVWALFALINGHSFIAWPNQRIMLLQTAVVGTAAIGATLIIISAGLDLSVGSTIALGVMVVALTLNAGAPPAVAVLAGIGAGALVGLLIGTLVAGYISRAGAALAGIVAAVLLWSRLGPAGALAVAAGTTALTATLGELFFRRLPLSPFIVTLGLWGALRGLAKGLGDNSTIYPADTGWLPSLMSLQSSGPATLLPPGVWICLLLALAMTLLLRLTPFGVHAYAIGSNELAARSCGVRVDRAKILIYTLGVACAGLASVLQFSFLTMGDPTTAEGYELRIIAAVVIGGASLSGGIGTVRGTLIGALIMTVVDNGCTQSNIQSWVQEVVTGGIIVAAVILDRMRHRTDR